MLAYFKIPGWVGRWVGDIFLLASTLFLWIWYFMDRFCPKYLTLVIKQLQENTLCLDKNFVSKSDTHWNIVRQYRWHLIWRKKSCNYLTILYLFNKVSIQRNIYFHFFKSPTFSSYTMFYLVMYLCKDEGGEDVSKTPSPFGT